MGLGMSVRMKNVFIDSKNKKDAVHAINKSLIEPDYKYYGRGEKTYRNLKIAIEDFAYSVEEDEEGNLSVEWDGEKYNNDEELWKVIAPYVRSGASIQFDFEHGSDVPSVLLEFEDGKITKKEAKIVWESKEI